VIPIAFRWTGSQVVMGTVPASAKVRALRQNPRVALTIDTEGFPLRVLDFETTIPQAVEDLVRARQG
jgi:nitroimidazol reductase NimA-like FMN-containing flavoprotein (pyridoxamine 5'-phosphate oxidase superfamily)